MIPSYKIKKYINQENECYYLILKRINPWYLLFLPIWEPIKEVKIIDSYEITINRVFYNLFDVINFVKQELCQGFIKIKIEYLDNLVTLKEIKRYY